MISAYIIWFFIFSFIGWIFETVLCTVLDGHYQNRGFLYGPVCPIYGLGAAVCILIADVVYHQGYYDRFNAWQIFIMGVVFSATLEYTVHCLLEKIFHATWWDYSRFPLNFHGRICVYASTLFGLSYMFIFKFVYPVFAWMRSEIPPQILEIIAFILVALMAVDTAITVSTLKRFESELKSMDMVINTNMVDLCRLMKEKRAESGEDDQGDGENIEKTRMRMAVDLAKWFARNMSRISVSAINRVRSFKYPRLIGIKMDTLIREIRKRNPFYKGEDKDQIKDSGKAGEEQNPSRDSQDITK